MLEQFGTQALTEKTWRSMQSWQLEAVVQLRQFVAQLTHALGIVLVRNLPGVQVRQFVLDVHVRQLAGLQGTAWLTPVL